MEAIDVIGVPVSTAPLERIAQTMVSWAREPVSISGPRYVCATSAHGVVEAHRDPSFREILQRAALVVPDGMPLVWVGRMRGQRHMTLVPGPSLMLAVCRLSAGMRVRHFFYGGAPGVADELARRFSERFPGLQVAGTYCPPFHQPSGTELDEIAGRITESGADVVWVGLSTPKQERWIAEIRRRVRVRVLCSVGAAFDFHTGRARQPPVWIQQAGLGWIFRLVQEPRRLWRRYASTIPRFVWLATRQLLGRRC